jgi:hypothetical protein
MGRTFFCSIVYMENQRQTEERRIKKNQYLQTYRATHKEEIARKRNIRTTCSCGREVSKRHLEEHLKTKGHAISLKKHTQELTELLEQKTNPDVAQYIVSFL